MKRKMDKKYTFRDEVCVNKHWSFSSIFIAALAALYLPKCDIPVPGILQFFRWYRNRNQKYLVPKKVSEPVLKKIGTEKSIGNGLQIIWYRKKSRNWSRKNLVPKKDIGTSLEIFQNICVDLGLGLFPSPGFLHFSFDQTITSPFRPCQTMLHCCTQFTTFVIFWQLVATCSNL